MSARPPLRRRTLLHAALATALPAAVSGCGPPPGGNPGATGGDPDASAARLTARLPAAAAAATATPVPGTHALDLGQGPEVLLHVPASAGTAEPATLVLALHGAGGTAQAGLAPLLGLAEAHRLVLLAPSAHGSTWDALTGGWGPDARRVDQALARVLATHPVRRVPLAVSGFSDGASYALSLGLANADLFTHAVAFSPGSIIPAPRVGTPRVFVSHGRSDEVLPLDRTTRRIVAELDAAKVPTEVRIFDGPHTVPPDIAAHAVQWLLD